MSVGDFVRRLIPTDLFGGMAVTGGYLFRRKETVQYPEKRLEPAARFRGRRSGEDSHPDRAS